jgi:hypothetical protein
VTFSTPGGKVWASPATVNERKMAEIAVNFFKRIFFMSFTACGESQVLKGHDFSRAAND